MTKTADEDIKCRISKARHTILNGNRKESAQRDGRSKRGARVQMPRPKCQEPQWPNMGRPVNSKSVRSTLLRPYRPKGITGII
ncbi:hypothetical protein PoB_006983900 [Plakobranchus ocellatus]|uniref:Uncharacterized protein n=1 Tax=Plakobranchus ocellatus TaxID=259542 RepID=A0AAV4DH28_9GAST|nr:hypothetical protein PoB_006983900 [Plakobranchus ocellatus]